MRLLWLFGICLAQPAFQSVTVTPPSPIEWDQGPMTFYTGQTLNTSWIATNVSETDRARITYPGVGGTRTLTTGALINASSYAVRLSDSTNGLATNVPVTIALSTNTAISLTSTDLISVVQSKLMNIVPYDGTRVLGGGQNTVCDDRNLTVSWRGLGEAQFGTATVSVVRQGGGGNTLISAQTFPAAGNTSANLVCSRTLNPSTFSTYAFSISVVEPGGTAYTGSSASFSIGVAPSPAPTPTKTPSSTPTPTNTLSATPSPSRTSTPSSTPSSTSTSSNTPTIPPTSSSTPAPSVDYLAIARAAVSQVDTQTPVIIGTVSGMAGILLVFFAYRYYQARQNRIQRLRRRNVIALREGYLYKQEVPTEEGFMYSRQVAAMKQGFAPTGRR